MGTLLLHKNIYVNGVPAALHPLLSYEKKLNLALGIL